MQTITIQTITGTAEIEAVVMGDFAVHKTRLLSGRNDGTYTVTHIPSGMMISPDLLSEPTSFWWNEEDAIRFVEIFSSQIDSGDILQEI